MDKLKLKVPPVLVLLVLILLVYFLKRSGLVFIVSMNTVYSPYILTMIGCVIAVLGVWEFRKKKTSVNPHNPNKASRLVTGGIYRITRNPMYLGMLLVLIGVILRFENILGFVTIPIYILYMNQFQIKPEEQIIETKFAAEYIAYKNKVRRWL
ncbi:isoprenylcysteine carboxylmethyltransferase family protein [Paraglaciecola sp. L3A3]|uniref:methyltransferase family protein n=1 Tax=Paraglaciecola sp. L3A3 TaxID=2686358 RepID=UPI00131B12FF|nr:isoprenylcysteine carboxylmethyltransferase family protein [Paraglaciecola sp. L3A3]